MFLLRPASLGAVCLLCAGALDAAPVDFRQVSAPPAWRAALQAVWSASPEIAAARAELEAARARAAAAAQPLYNPELSLEVENADVKRRVIGIGLPLDLSGKRRVRGAQGDAKLRAAEASFAVARQALAVRWLKATTTATLASRQSELGRQRVQLMQRFDELAERRLKVGDLSSPERDLAALALGEAQMQQAALEGDAAGARAAVLAIAGVDATEKLPPTPSDLPPDADAIAPKPLQELPTLIGAHAELAAAEAGVGVAQRARLPDPVLSLAGGEVRSGHVRDNVIGVSVSIPLPVRNSGGAEVQAARAEANAASAGLRVEERQARARLAESKARYTALRTAAGAFRNGRAAAYEDRTTLLEKLWRAGEIGTSDYLVQLKQSLDTALSGCELESRVWQAWFDYLAAAGRLADWIDGEAQETSR